MPKRTKTTASLVFIGDDLAPDEITNLLKKAPSRSQKKGKKIDYPVRKDVRIPKFGNWVLQTERVSPGDLDSQIKQLLHGATEDLQIWQSLSSKYDAHIFCGLWLKEGNEGIAISSETMRDLADRGLDIDFDIYAPEAEAG